MSNIVTFTAGLTPESVIEERLPPTYEMKLTKPDMLTVIAALSEMSGTAPPHISTTESEADDALSLRTSILWTLGIEEI